MEPRELSRAIRRRLTVTAVAAGSIVTLTAAVAGSRILLAVGAIELALACILAAIEMLPARSGDGPRVPLDDDHHEGA